MGPTRAVSDYRGNAHGHGEASSVTGKLAVTPSVFLEAINH
jgi:hypothetical protein